MATKTKAIEVKVDERLALEIADKGVKSWRSTSFSNGKRRVYVIFEEVVRRRLATCNGRDARCPRELTLMSA